MTPHFEITEALSTSTGLTNRPEPDQMQAVIKTATEMEIVRACLGRKPIKINSWFRAPEVNKAVGGTNNSEHLTGRAVDFVCPAFGTPYDICRTLISLAHVINYNQLIYEGTWVHISFPPDGETGKKQVLTKKSGKYLEGLVK